MKLMQLAKLLLNEGLAEEYLGDVRILKDFKKFIHGNFESIGRIRR